MSMGGRCIRRIRTNVAMTGRSCRCGGRLWDTTRGSRRFEPINRRSAGSASVVGKDRKFGLVKVNPLLSWSRRDVWAFIATHDVPYNPLHDQGYPSIGCWPCTRAVDGGDAERAGRWAGHAKTECGLHSLDSSLL